MNNDHTTLLELRNIWKSAFAAFASKRLSEEKLLYLLRNQFEGFDLMAEIESLKAELEENTLNVGSAAFKAQAKAAWREFLPKARTELVDLHSERSEKILKDLDEWTETTKDMRLKMNQQPKLSKPATPLSIPDKSTTPKNHEL